MYYELYIDVFWMTNFMMDSLLLFAVRQMLKCPVGKGRIFMGGIVGSTMTCLIVLLPLSGLLRFFAGGILTALVMIRVGFGKRTGQDVQKGICFLVYFCISDEWNPAAVPPVYGYDESVFCNCVSRICGAERNTKPVGKHSGRTEADLRGTSDTE